MDERNSRSATVWLLDIERVTESAVVDFEQRLAASEARRYANFARMQRKRQFLVGRMLLRLAVAKMMHLPVHKITVRDRVGSAPELFVTDGPSSTPNFSISHSRNWVGCALSTEVMLGFDIEVNDFERDIVAHDFGIEGWKPDKTEKLSEPEKKSGGYVHYHTIFLWNVRPN